MFLKNSAKIMNDILKNKSLDAIIILSDQNIKYWALKDSFLSKDDISYFIYPKNIYLKKDMKIGIHLDSIPCGLKEKLSKKYKLVNISKEIDKKRMIKTKGEISKIKKACKKNKEIYDNIISKEIFYTNEIELAIKIRKYSIGENEDIAFSPIVAYGKNTSSIHHVPKKYISQDIIIIDYGTKYKGYHSDMTLTITNKKELHKYVEDISQLVSMLEDIAREGTSISELNNYAKKYLEKYGKASFIHHHLLGHGVGVDIHEKPAFYENTILKKNMIITLEPGLYFKNKFGIRIENTYQIRKEKRAKNLCSIDYPL